jgi:hypothetical protein
VAAIRVEDRSGVEGRRIRYHIQRRSYFRTRFRNRGRIAGKIRVRDRPVLEARLGRNLFVLPHYCS